MKIELELKERGIKGVLGGSIRWKGIHNMLTNITYTGNLLFQKSYISDPIQGKKKKNNGELPMYYVENTHKAIIEQEIFEKVQEELKKRKKCKIIKDEGGNIQSFKNKIICGHCNRIYTYKSKKDKLGYWGCLNKKYKTCIIKEYLPHKVIIEKSCEVLGIEEFSEDVFNEQIQNIIIYKERVIIFKMNDEREIKVKWEAIKYSELWTPEKRKLWSEYQIYRRKEKASYKEFLKIKEELDGKSNNHTSEY